MDTPSRAREQDLELVSLSQKNGYLPVGRIKPVSYVTDRYYSDHYKTVTHPVRARHEFAHLPLNHPCNRRTGSP